MRALLISTYDLGRQPFGLASPAAWLRHAGVDVTCVDTSRDSLEETDIVDADVVAFYLPMHTATRLAAPVLERVRLANPRALLAAYGLYAPLNAAWLRERGVTHIFGPEAEAALVTLVNSQTTRLRSPAEHASYGEASPKRFAGRQVTPNSQGQRLTGDAIPRLQFIQPDRSSLPPLSRYASLIMPDGSRRTVGSTEATRGCKHLCRHCPIVPVYQGAFRAVPLDVVMADIGAQVAGGAQHITFGDPDFFNGPTHARKIVERVAHAFPTVTYDVTIKIEHLLKHADLLDLLRDTGCLFVTSAVESIDDAVLEKLRKGHTRADFVRAVARCRDSGLTLVPTFVAFTPWTTVAGYVDLVDEIERLDLIEQVAPIQLAIRLLVTAESALLELPDIRGLVQPFDGESLTWPWHHPDRRVDLLQQDVMRLVGSAPQASRADMYAAISLLARERGGVASTPRSARSSPRVPYLSEAWYCCAEPMEIRL